MRNLEILFVIVLQIFAASDGRSSVEQSRYQRTCSSKFCRRYRARNPPPTSSKALTKRLLESSSRFYEMMHRKWGSTQYGGACDIKDLRQHNLASISLGGVLLELK